MVYVICPRCCLTTYSAALWASVERCPRCNVELPAARRGKVVPLRRRTPRTNARDERELSRGTP